MQKQNNYVGINNDMNGGLTNIGKIIIDAWVFGVIPETETCEGWTIGRMNTLMEQVNTEWDKYGLMVSQLPPELAERHKRIYDEIIKKANKAGWSGEAETDDEG